MAVCLLIPAILLWLTLSWARASRPAVVPDSGADSSGSTAVLALDFDADAGLTEEDWPHDPGGSAFFLNGEYHLYARSPGQFVAVSAPITTPIRNAQVSAQFREIGGPP